jgi:glycolate oxidase iron-sulfur subunit
MDSPRGRIVLMKQVLEGDLGTEEVRPYIDRCLGCLACETACPSGVRYRELVVPFRGTLEDAGARSWHARWSRAALLAMLESPGLFRAAYFAGRTLRRGAQLLGGRSLVERFALLSMLRAPLPSPTRLPATTPAIGKRRGRVALLAGCVQQTLRPSINSATVRLLAANGVEVIVPVDQGCCGALALHAGHLPRAERLMTRNTRAFPPDVDAIVTNAAGCGSAMKEHHYAAPVQDVSELLDTLGLITTHSLERPTLIAYHDACHLSHGQGVRTAPRRLLQQVANLTLAELADGETCCGSAGLYNLEQPHTAAELGRRKAAAITASGATVVAAGNIGCMTQIEAHCTIPVRHTVEILAYSLQAGN